MSATIQNLSIRERRRYLERLVGSAMTEGATPDAIDAVLVGEGGVTKPEMIRDFACRRKRLPTLGAGELTALGGRDALRARFGLDPAPIVKSDFVLNDRGVPDDHNQENIRLALTKLGYAFGYDALACAEYVTQGSYAGPLDDAVMNRAWLNVDTAFGFLSTYQFFEIVVRDFARQGTHHPVLEYLSGLDAWDGTPRIDTWLSIYAGVADTPFVRAVGVLPLIAAVRRVREHGTKFDELLVLYGPQGQGKSKLLRTLCPQAEWFTDCLALGDDAKRVIENTRGIWIAEIGELQGTQREVERIKVFLSRSVDGPVRLAYGRQPVRAPRQFVSFGSTNDEFFLKDVTGNRRFWPVTVGNMKPDLLAKDRDQLWAEVVVREAKGESIHLPETLWPDATAAQEAHREQDPWEELLEEKLELAKPVVPVAVTWTAVGLGLDQSSKRDNRNAKRISDAMKRLGFVAKKNIRVDLPGGKTNVVRCWVRDRALSSVAPTDVAVVNGAAPF